MKNALQNYLIEDESNYTKKIQFFNTKNVSVNVHPEHSNLFQFCIFENQNQQDDIIDCCTGIILDCEDDTTFPIVALTPKVIHKRTKLTDKKFTYEEKIDGTTVILWYYNNKWMLSTKYDIQEEKVEKLFFKYFPQKYLDVLDTNCTHIFEICSPFNKKIVDHKTIKIYYLSSHNISTHEEFRMPELSNLCPTKYKFSSWEEAENFVQSQDTKVFEGLIAIDRKNIKYKIKNKTFTKKQNFVESFDFKKGIILAIKGDDTFASEFPEIASLYAEMKKMISNICSKYDKIYELAIKNSSSKQEFGMKVVSHTSFTSPLFAMYDKKVKNMKEYLSKMNPDRLVMMLEKGEI